MATPRDKEEGSSSLRGLSTSERASEVLTPFVRLFLLFHLPKESLFARPPRRYAVPAGSISVVVVGREVNNP